jgi:hypothetical protein
MPKATSFQGQNNKTLTAYSSPITDHPWTKDQPNSPHLEWMIKKRPYILFVGSTPHVKVKPGRTKMTNAHAYVFLHLGSPFTVAKPLGEDPQFCDIQ